MNPCDSSGISSTSDNSNSEGEYVLSGSRSSDSKINESAESDSGGFTNWSPTAGVGTSYLGLLPPVVKDFPYGSNYKQESPPRKLKVSHEHRKLRHKEFVSGKTVKRDFHESKLLREAVSADKKDLVEKLLENGTEANNCDSRSRTPLHIAAAKGNEQIVSLLLDHGADPNAKDSIGNTPLHLASCTCQVPVVTLLLNAGTDLNLLDNTGRSPLHLARGRLMLLQEDMSYSNEQLRTQVKQVLDMMRAYICRKGQQVQSEELESLCKKLHETNTREELDQVGTLLSSFADMNLQKGTTPS